MDTGLIFRQDHGNRFKAGSFAYFDIIKTGNNEQRDRISGFNLFNIKGIRFIALFYLSFSS